MNNFRRFQALRVFLLTLIATSCSNVNEQKTFLTTNNITESKKIPTDYDSKEWKKLAGDYVYFMDLFKINNLSQLLYIVANKKEKKMLFVYHVNPHIMPATYVKGVTPLTVVTNYEEISENDFEMANDLTEMNALLQCIPKFNCFRYNFKDAFYLFSPAGS
jgi:hypothetical protein